MALFQGPRGITTAYGEFAAMLDADPKYTRVVVAPQPAPPVPPVIKPKD